MDIDIVVSWVDMEDPAWKADFAKYKGSIDNTTNQFSEARFRDYGLLKYWFRGIEKFAPWFRKIHFVTCGQKPEWLDASNPRLHLVNHSDYIPKEFLPVFNSAVIELHLHRIPGLADRFIYFNDDFYMISPTPQERFFSPEGLPKDIAAFRLNTGANFWSKRIKNNIRIINDRFDKKGVLSKYHDKWFSPEYGSRSWLTRLLQPYGKFVTLKIPHNAQPYLKESFEQVWEYAPDKLAEASTHRFRSPDDYTQELFRTWQICSGNFEAYNTYKDTRMFPLIFKAAQGIDAVRNQRYKLVCLNDNVHIRNYDMVMRELQEAFEQILPGKSSFEL